MNDEVKKTGIVIIEDCSYAFDCVNIIHFDKDQIVKDENQAAILLGCGYAEERDINDVDFDKLAKDLEVAQAALVEATEKHDKSEAKDKSKLAKAIEEATEQVKNAEKAMTEALEG